jgi:hypothetical protein
VIDAGAAVRSTLRVSPPSLHPIVTPGTPVADGDLSISSSCAASQPVTLTITTGATWLRVDGAYAAQTVLSRTTPTTVTVSLDTVGVPAASSAAPITVTAEFTAGSRVVRVVPVSTIVLTGTIHRSAAPVVLAE